MKLGIQPHRTELQPEDGRSPNQVAVDETVIWFDGEQYRLYADGTRNPNLRVRANPDREAPFTDHWVQSTMSNDHLPTARNVHHVSVTVSDLDAAVEFFREAIGCELLYGKGPFGDPDGDSMTRRLGVHPDAEARLAMLRCGPTTNLELFEWDAPDQASDPPENSDVGAMHIGLQVEDIDAAIEALAAHEDVEILDGPQTNSDGPTAGLTYIFCRTPWGFQLELLEAPEKMPYTEETDERLFGPAPSWEHRYGE